MGRESTGSKDEKDVDLQSSVDWFRAHEQPLPWWGRICKRVLQIREIPKHIAFVMDGNRRYARQHHLRSAIHGHSKGFDNLTCVLDWCRELGVEEVTLYAFSIDNFKRGEEEVNGLMQMAEQKFEKLLAERDELCRRQICFRFFGDMTLLPRKIRSLIVRIENLTRDHKSGVVNVCLAYMSQNEITRAIEWIRRGVQMGLLLESDINQSLISRCLDSRRSDREVDMLIRTSGERRLSDFLLWQCSHCYVHFEEALWPDLNLGHLFNSILGYQQSRRFIEGSGIFGRRNFRAFTRWHITLLTFQKIQHSSSQEAEVGLLREGEQRIACFLLWVERQKEREHCLLVMS